MTVSFFEVLLMYGKLRGGYSEEILKDLQRYWDEPVKTVSGKERNV